MVIPVNNIVKSSVLDQLKKFKHKGIEVFALIEICIGCSTLFATVTSALMGTSAKPLNVLLFVIIASLTSFSIGVGLLFKRNLASQLLVYFAFSILLTKILIFARIIYLEGSLVASIPGPLKDSISAIYHAVAFWYFNREDIKSEFRKRV